MTDFQLATLVAVGLLFALLVWRRRENWEFVKDGIPNLSKADHQRVREACLAGKQWSQIVSDPAMKDLAVYDAEAVWKVCRKARREAADTGMGGMGESKGMSNEGRPSWARKDEGRRVWSPEQQGRPTSPGRSASAPGHRRMKKHGRGRDQ